MKKRFFKTLACTMLAASMLFTACGEAADTKGTPTGAPTSAPTQNTPSDMTPTVDAGPNFTVPAGGYDGSKVTVVFYHTMGQNLSSVLDEYIAEFNKLYPNITIEASQVGSYDDVRDQISTELTVGSEPNIAYSNGPRQSL
jgi:ABC-type glycerol-3-phosphate transport system substrate-binding protein